MNLLLAITLLAAGPFVGEEQRLASLRNPIDLTLVRSADATLLVWNEDSKIRGRLDDRLLDFGTGTDPRAATDGRDFQVVWVAQDHILGTRTSDPSNVQQLVRLSAFQTDFGSTYRRAPAIAWTGRFFQIYAGTNPADTAASADGLVFTAVARSLPKDRMCMPSLFLGIFCWDVPDSYTLNWSIRTDSTARTGTFAQNGYTSIHFPGSAAGKGEFLIVWKTPTAIDGMRLRSDGSVAGFINVPVARSLGGARGPQVAWDGTRYLIVFDNPAADGNLNVLGAVIEPGQYLAQPFEIAASAERESAPVVTAAGDGEFLVSYVVNRDAIGTRAVSFREPPSRRRATR
jgi:hypothetical protein